jgi:uncharacterized protein (TIGR00251 family)
VKLFVYVRTGAKSERVENLPGSNELKVHVKAPPVEGKANKAVCRLLAQHFSVPPSSVRVVFGMKSKKKLIEISFPPK